MISQTLFYRRDDKSNQGKLSLIALMDIFTILVFFLLLNSGDSKNIEHAKFVQLPNSSAGKAPYAEISIMVGSDKLWVDEKAIASVDNLLADPDQVIVPLQVLLQSYRERMGELQGYEKQNGLALTIMGQHDVPYSLIKTVMATCQLEGFRNISLAVNRIAAQVQTTSQSIGSDGAGVPSSAAPAALTLPAGG
ncbi:ExbD/TolR family protein [Teredinibacter waterburyi]|uniref:ExbD/TolR family protein n=1 Tax=Teredinibacter waterburyi TaxID=1500538 RepID=UPI00165FA4EE|nr:biopolymer transporter ExbD [Teredinibacter waterburyi]